MFLRLCWRAPRTTSLVRPMIHSAPSTGALALSRYTEARITFNNSSGTQSGQLETSCKREIPIMDLFLATAARHGWRGGNFSTAYSVLCRACRATGNFSGEYRIFTQDERTSTLKIRMLEMAYRLHPSGWGARAEDPFRGLRAGPVRRPLLFFVEFFALSPTSRKPQNAPKPRRRCV
jgi:hypothetical protein